MELLKNEEGVGASLTLSSPHLEKVLCTSNSGICHLPGNTDAQGKYSSVPYSLEVEMDDLSLGFPR